jgi:hypothetical protein
MTHPPPADSAQHFAPAPSPLYHADNPAVTTHINLLQGIINRLAGNSSSCKTWCLALVSALLGLAGATHNPAIVTFALVPVVIFAFVDTMYLARERAFRDLYARIVQAVRDDRYERSSVFDTSAVRNADHVLWALGSWSIWPIYGGLIVAYIVAAQRGWLDLLAAAPAKS